MKEKSIEGQAVPKPLSISRTGKSGTRHLLNKTKNKAIPCPREKVVMIAMNVALEDVYKKVFADSYQHGAPLGVKRPWDFDRIHRDQLIDILIEEENPG